MTIARIAIGVVISFLGYAYLSIRPPAPRICGSPGGPPVTSPRVKLSDGRHLAYKENGVSKEEAKYKIIVCHSIGESKDSNLPVSQGVSGAALVAPISNYWWKCLPSKLSKQALGKHLFQDRLALHVARYTPWLLNWWITQKWFPTISILQGKLDSYSRTDLEILKLSSGIPEEEQGYEDKFTFLSS
ncbi:hypothetical protein OROMI_011731 [Orobanche minor]